MLRQLVTTPVMAHAVAVAYENVPQDAIATAPSPEAQRSTLFSAYVARRLSHQDSIAYSPTITQHYLRWLANQLTAHGHTTFHLEELQATWLDNEMQRLWWCFWVGLIYGLLAALAFGMIIALVFETSFALLAGPTLGLAVGATFAGAFSIRRAVIYGVVSFVLLTAIWTTQADLPASILRAAVVGGPAALVTSLTVGRFTDRIEMVEKLGWSWQPILQLGIWVGLIFGTLFAVAGWLVLQKNGIIFGPVGGLIAGGAYGLVNSTAIGDRLKPNEGIKQSRRDAIRIGLVVGLAARTAFGVAFWLERSLAAGIRFAVLGTVVWSLTGALISDSGIAVIRHYILRLLLWRAGSIPFRFAKFLDHSVDLHFLHDIGGGYIFRHRMLMDYFAGLEDE